MKKFITILLIAIFAFSAFSCTGGNVKDTEKVTDAPSETAAAPATEVKETEAQTEEPIKDVDVPDVTLTYVAADVYTTKEAAAETGYKEASKMNIADWFMPKKELDSNYEFIIPEEFALLDGYVFRIPQAKHVMEIDVFKVKDKADVQKIVKIAEDRYEKLKSSDWRLYDADGSNALIIETGKIEAIGNFVVFTLTNDSETSMLRAKHQIFTAPDCSAVDVYKAITCDIAE